MSDQKAIESGQLTALCPYILSKKLLGTGSFAAVLECKNVQNGKHYAAKKYTKKLLYGLELMLQKEFEVLKRVLHGHKNILLMEDYFETEKCIYLVTELARGGELYDRIVDAPEKHLSVEDTSLLLQHLLLALQHLHSNGIVHRDIKAENILFKLQRLNASLMLLADFGTAVMLRDGELELKNFSGTLSYLAPEVVARQPFSFPVDMWSVGVLTYFMLCGYMPFDCDTDKETKELIQKADYVFEPEEHWLHVPETAKDFIAACFELIPEKRITAQEALGHPFVRGAYDDNIVRAAHKLRRMQNQLLTNLRGSNALTLSLREYPTISGKLLGDCCYSPQTVSKFTTPVASASTTPFGSQTLIHSRPKTLQLPLPQLPTPKKATFVL